ncbi:MAG: 1-deoxy-D-xylulose-5-phosphate synthase [Vicingaceae bacterium]|nr:MAG: 1-deoxy-D-xylulose-5-phosphate synthase [Vicingaceae bacterium]
MSNQPYKAGPLLSTINSPADLKKLPKEKLPQLADELRQFIIDVVSEKGGHFGASLGTVEMTIALHYVFDTPRDLIVWDVGHQAYGHKIITGRRDVFHTNRLYKGISGFPKRSESPYDTFGVGHSSTSISAALGMAIASKLKNEEKQVVAVIGDGALTGGMAFEALNHAGAEKANMLVVLNDNCMSIDPNVGALKEYLTDLTTSKAYNKIKDEVWSLLGKISQFGPDARSIVQKIENTFKSVILEKSNLFEALQFRYFGPTDGHDLLHLVELFEHLKTIPGPKILHCLTKKGKGYKPAEEGNPTVWHAPGIFDKNTGEIIKPKKRAPTPPKYQDVFGHTLVELASKNEKIVGITPAMPSGSSMNIMMEKFPNRAFDVGIAEQHAVTFSAGLATQGLVPFCNIYSSFMQRAYDQVIHDVALQKLHVVFCLDRAGLVGADGPTHHGAFDIAYFRCIPNMIVCAPMNEEELRDMMYTAQLEKNAGPWAIRYPRGEGVMPNWKTPLKEISVGKGVRIKNGEDLAILSIGHIGNLAMEAIRELESEYHWSIALYNMRFVKPIDELMLHEIFGKYKHIITVEDGCLMGGFGSAVLEFAADQGYKNSSIVRLGIPDRFIEHGTQQELYRECGYDKNSIKSTVIKLMQTQNKQVNLRG